MDNQESKEVILQQMHDTRSSLADKLENLERQVTDTVQTAASAVTDTVASVKDAVHDTVATVKDSVQSGVASVKDSFDIPAHVERHPWAMMAGSVAVGYLGGRFLSGSGSKPARERRPGFELPLQAAPMSRRLLAGSIDSLLVISAFAVFAYIFFRVTLMVPPLRQAVGTSAILAGVFWAAYQYLLLVYTGSTPGLKLARLQLSRFDGTAVPRKVRHWRLLASLLSGLSLALGYAWCFLDEDRLCWHDRITRTYMAPRASREQNK